MTSLVGTSFYIAPEVVEGEYTKAADLWYYPPNRSHHFGTISHGFLSSTLSRPHPRRVLNASGVPMLMLM